MDCKICTKCNKNKELDKFYYMRGTKDNKRPECQECTRRCAKTWNTKKPKSKCADCGTSIHIQSARCKSCFYDARRTWRIDKYGYVLCSVNGTNVYQHRYVMEISLGRALLMGENVHHKNGVRSDNRLENLELWVTSQPSGQRPQDLIEWAKEILKRYEKGPFGNG